ncbi:MAG: hypothetical protein AAGD07_12725 [Planctomycetota bacterium]
MPADRETVADLIARLGPLPQDVQEEWIVQLRQRGVTVSSEAIDWERYSLGEDGILQPTPVAIQEGPSTRPTTADAPSFAHGAEQEKEAAKPRVNRSRLGTSVLAGTTTLLVLGMGWLLYANSTRVNSAPTNKVASTSPDPFAPGTTSFEDAPQPDEGAPDFTASAAVADPNPATFDFIDSGGEFMGSSGDFLETMTDAGADAASGFEADGLLLDSLLPASITGTSDRPTTEPTETSTPAASADIANMGFMDGSLGASTAMEGNEASPDGAFRADEPTMGALGNIADLTEQDGDEGPTAETRTTESPSGIQNAVRLPAIPRRAEDIETALHSVSLPAGIDGRRLVAVETLASVDRLQWSIQDGTANTSPIIESADQKLIAQIEPSPDGVAGWRFLWLADAAGSQDARQLLNGRLMFDDVPVYMRSQASGDAVSMDLSNRDSKLRWDLEGPLPAKTGELLIDIQIPEDIELAWIEVPERDRPQRTRGVATVHLKDDENVAVAVRMDILTTDHLSLRIRYGARIDTTMPWQWTDRAMIDQSLAQVADRVLLLEQQQLQLEKMESQASRLGGRRQALVLEDRIESLKTVIEQWSTLRQRLQALSRLAAEMASHAQLTLRLAVAWPDEPYPILRLGQSP